MSEHKIPSFFNGRSIGRNLREVTVDLIKTENDDLINRWFHSAPGTDLFTWTDQHKNIIKQQISFNGQVVEWNCLEGIKTGLVVESDLQSKGTQESEEPQSETIHFDPHPQERSVSLALEILRHMETDKGLLDQLIGNFENPQNIKTMEPEDFIARFGLALKNYQKQDAGFWNQWRRWVQRLFNRKS